MIDFGAREQQFGLPQGFLARTAQIESGGNPLAKNPNSSAKGLFQFIDSTAQQFGLNNPFDPEASTNAAARLAQQNAGVLGRTLGRSPTAAELYLAHQQGAGGASKLLANPEARAVDVVGADAVRLNGGNPNMTAGEFAGLWLNKFDRASGQPTGGNQMQQGLLSTQGSVQGTPFNPQQGQQPQAQQPRGILGALSNPDFLDRLAIAFEGMTLNPNQGVIASSSAALKGRAEERKEQGAQQQEQQRRQASLEFLRQQGRGDLAQALEAGVITPADAGRIALTPAERQGQLVTAEQLRGQFPGATIEEGLYNLKPDGTATKVGGGGTSVTVNSGSEVGNIPPGFELITDPTSGARRMQPIPGGPAAREIEGQQQAEQQRAQSQQAQGQVKESIVARDADRLIQMLDQGGMFNLPEAGIVGGALGGLGVNQEAVDFKNTLSSIQATVAFDTLQQMREASKTGGALGAVSERELDLLISARGALQQNTSPQVLKENLKTIKEIMTKIENDPVASRYLSGQTSAAPQGSAGGFSVTGRID